MERFDFIPGQFVSLTVSLGMTPVGERRITRAYSICSPPSGNRFELCLNRVKTGLLSPRLFELQPGDEVEMKGPVGYFTIRRPESDLLMVATGTGIAPMRAMIPHWLRHGGTSRCVLIQGARYEETLLYRDEWKRLAQDHTNFHFWPTLSRPHLGWRGRAGHVQAHLMEAVGERRDLDVYVCGLEAMVDDVRALLKNKGFDRQRIIHEKYD